MQIIINIEKRHLYMFVLLIGLVGGMVFAFNPGGTGGTPSIMGHSFDELGPGTTDLDAGEIVIQGTPGSGDTILTLRNQNPSAGTALDVDGDSLFRDDIYFSGDTFYVSGEMTLQGDVSSGYTVVTVRDTSSGTGNALDVYGDSYYSGDLTVLSGGSGTISLSAGEIYLTGGGLSQGQLCLDGYNKIVTC